MAAESRPSGWRLAKLSDLGEVNRGRSRHRPRYAEHLYGGPYPFIQTGDVKNSGGRITTYEQTYSEAGLAQSRLWPAGTMCITIAANIAETGILAFPACFPDSVVGFVADPARCDVRFVEYTFRHIRQQIQHEASGSVQDNINLETLERLRFPLPPFPEQRAIAHILGTLDDKIELNRQMNQTLEQIAAALFKSWFVDFDPVRAKAAGRQPEGMDAETAALFPNRMVASEIGEIPEGWSIGAVGGLAEFVDCLHSKKPSRAATGRPLLQLSNIRDDGLLDMTDTYFITDEDYKRWTSRIEVRQGDCVITNVGRVGAVAQIPYGFLAAIGRNMTAIRPRSTFPYPTWLLQLLISGWMKQEISNRTDSGTILDALNVRNIPLLRLVLADERIVQKFETIAYPMRRRMELNLSESRTLAELRDTLLPRLLSGELRIPIDVLDEEAVPMQSPSEKLLVQSRF